jgi:predicted kinase
VISLDDIRQERKTAATDRTGNGQAIQAAKEKAKEYLRSKKNFVWNATNITRQMRSQLIDLFLTYKAEVQIVYVEVPYAKLHAQNKSREAAIPVSALEKLVRKMEVPGLWEAHNVVYHVS